MRLPARRLPGRLPDRLPDRLPAAVRRWVWLGLFSLLAFQALGLVHRVLHAGPALPGGPVSVLEASATAQPPWLGHVAGGQDCQLLDQLSQALGPGVQALAWTAVLPDAPLSTPQPHSASPALHWRAPARAPPRA